MNTVVGVEVASYGGKECEDGGWARNDPGAIPFWQALKLWGGTTAEVEGEGEEPRGKGRGPPQSSLVPN